jgi:ATP-dependent protease ClpP protease subunit
MSIATFSKSNVMKLHDKRKMKYRNNSDGDDSDEDGIDPNIISSLKEKTRVFRDHNHIYFRDSVTPKSVHKLTDLIDEYNREQEITRVCNTTGIIVPRPIYLHITSYGGDLIAGFMAYDYIRNSKLPIYTIADGYAVSSGANMFMAGKKRLMTKNSYLLVHQLNITKQGTETFHDMMDNAANIIEFMSRIYALYLNNLRYQKDPVDPEDILTKNKIENHMLHDIYWNIETCMRYGLADGEYTGYVDADVCDTEHLLIGTVIKPTTTNIYELKDLIPSDAVVEAIKNKSDKQQKGVLDLVRDFIKKRKTVCDGKDKENDTNDVINDTHEQKIYTRSSKREKEKHKHIKIKKAMRKLKK